MPELSVVIVTNDTYEVCRRSMHYAKLLDRRDAVEIVLVGPNKQRINADLDDLNHFGSYQIVEIGDFDSTGAATTEGIRAARAPMVAYLEEHDYIPTDYAQKIIDSAKQIDAPAICFAMLPANPGLVAWAHIFLQFGEVVPPIASGPVLRAGGHHVAYRRDRLLEYGDRLVDVITNEGIIFEDLSKNGEELYLRGDLVVEHVQISKFGTLVRMEFISQRIYAAARVRAQDWSVAKRVIYALGAPLIPFLRVSRGLKQVRRSGRSTGLMPQVAFVMFAAACAGATGEMLGYLFGTKESHVRERTDVELDRYSYVRSADRKNVRNL